MRTKVASTALAILLIAGLPKLLSKESKIEDKLEYLGVVRVTKYTHNEGGRITASGYYLKDRDQGKLCAVSRDWFRKKVKVWDVIYLEHFNQTCIVVDTMALQNSKGFKQTKWVDVYHTSVEEALEFGIQRSKAYLVRTR